MLRRQIAYSPASTRGRTGDEAEIVAQGRQPQAGVTRGPPIMAGPRHPDIRSRPASGREFIAGAGPAASSLTRAGEKSARPRGSFSVQLADWQPADLGQPT